MQQIIIATAVLIASSFVSAGLSFAFTDTAARTETFNIGRFVMLPAGLPSSVGYFDFMERRSQMAAHIFRKQESDNNEHSDTLGGNAVLELHPTEAFASAAGNISPLVPSDFEFEGDIGKFAVHGNSWDKNTAIGLIGANMQIDSAGYDFVIDYDDGTGKRYSGDQDNFVIDVGAVPEPEIYAVMMIGLGLIGFSMCSQKRSV